jgi:hypothetical protein
MRERWAELQRWRMELVDELAVLPETLRQFREGVAHFQLVGKRLADSTEGIERVNQLYGAGVADTTRRLAEATAHLREQLGSTKVGKPPAQLMESAVEDFTRTVNAIADLNPFWPRRGGSAK